MDDSIKKLQKRLIAIKTPLADERRKNGVKPVLGEGSLTAKIMLVGEAPGKKEAETGKPFCGASGKFLSEMLASIGLTREDVYITNIVNDRPTDNRDPSSEEIAKYSQFLDKQIEIIKPKVIVTLGRFSMQYIMQKFGLVGIGSDKKARPIEPISKLHGKVFETQKIKIIPLYHPAAALYNGSMRATLLSDFKVIKSVI